MVGRCCSDMQPTLQVKRKKVKIVGVDGSIKLINCKISQYDDTSYV
jgi:hypothetical protein